MPIINEGVETMKNVTKLENNKIPNSQQNDARPGMKVKSRVKAGSVPDAPDRWKSQIQIVARGL
jgi:hypothetical protein